MDRRSFIRNCLTGYIGMNISNIVANMPRADWSIGTRNGKPRYITLHYNGPEIPNKEKLDRAVLNAVAKWHMRPNAFPGKDGKSYPGDGIMYHYAVLHDGNSYQLRNDNEQTWHCGHAEGNAWSLAVFLPLGGVQDATDAQWLGVVNLIEYLCEKYEISYENVKGHREWKPTECPGDNIMTRLLAWRAAEATIDRPDDEPRMEVPQFNASPVYSENSPLLYLNTDDPEKVVRFLMSRPKQPYTLVDIRYIVSQYVGHANSVGVDWMLAMAQCIHETDALRSWWAARPRRNPAGLGVTGEKRAVKPANQPWWSFNEKTNMWHRGHQFANWGDSAQAHIGHILCYALRDDQMSPAQMKLSAFSPRKAALPSVYRGCAPTLRGFNGRWAVPGHTYATSIAKLANVMREFN